MKSSLEGIEINSSRKEGNTTRIVDNAIQILFNERHVKIEDHYGSGESNLILLNKFLNRLQLEHNFVYQKLIRVNKEDPYNIGVHLFENGQRFPPKGIR